MGTKVAAPARALKKVAAPLRKRPASKQVAAPLRKRKANTAYDVSCEWMHTNMDGDDLRSASLNKRFRSMEDAVEAVSEFYEENGGDIQEVEVYDALCQNGSWEDETIDPDDDCRYHHDEGKCYTFNAAIAAAV